LGWITLKMEAIAGVPGIAAVLVGPYDLSASLGRIGQVDHPDATAARDLLGELRSQGDGLT
jgi:2-keto-3-deoxy-L-rhamnonate aldolase RhmA